MLSKEVKWRREANKDRRLSKSWHDLRATVVQRIYSRVLNQSFLSRKHLLDGSVDWSNDSAIRQQHRIAAEVSKIYSLSREEFHQYHKQFHTLSF